MNVESPQLESRTEAGPGHGRAVVLTALVGLLAYFSSLHGDYVLDDHRFTQDPKLEQPFASAMAPRPVIALSLALNYKVDGLNPRGYHAMNLAVHLLAALLLYDLVRRTLLLPRFEGHFQPTAGWIGLATGLLWMAHPLTTQSVTYVIQRCESFMGMFLLASLWCYVRGATSARGRWWYTAAFLCCALGAGCKEMMIVLAPLALLYDRTFLTGSWRQSLRRRWIPLSLLLVPPIAGILALAFTGFFTDPKGTVGFNVKLYTPYTYALTQSGVILHYLKLSVLPIGLTLDYLDWKPCTSLAHCWASVSTLAALLALTLFGIWRNAAWAFPAAWFFVCLAPTSSVVPVQDAAFEHRMYLPLAGFVVLASVGIASLFLARIPGKTWLLGGSAAAVIFMLSLLTAARNEDYSSSTKLMRDNAEKRPENGRVRLNLAVRLFAAGDVAGAEEQLSAAMQLPLQLPSLRLERVKVLREAGRIDEAVAAARQLHREQPDSDETAYEFGVTLLTAGQAAEALPLLQRAAERMPQNKFVRLHAGIVLQEVGQPAKAAEEFRATRDLDAEYSAKLSQTAGRVAADPDAKPAQLRLAAWYADAACHLTDTPSAEFLDTLAKSLARVGRFEEAANAATRAAAAARSRSDAYLASRFEAHAAAFRNRKTLLPATP